MITDPQFYFWAIAAVLLVGLSKSGFLSGFGAVATPLMAMAVPVPQAAAIMLPLLCLMDLTSLQQMWRNRDQDLLRLLVCLRQHGCRCLLDDLPLGKFHR